MIVQADVGTGQDDDSFLVEYEHILGERLVGLAQEVLDGIVGCGERLLLLTHLVRQEPHPQ